MSIFQIRNRWIVVAGAILIQLALGAFYAWSVFTRLLTDPQGDYGFSATQTAWIFSAGLATFALVMVVAGRIQPKTGPTLLSMAGGLLLGLGYLLGGFFGYDFWSQFFFIGIMSGAGVGLAYVVPIAVGVKWFPDRKGLITGLAVAGFGFGATIWVKLAGSWFGGLLNTFQIFDLPPVQSVFVLYGFIFAGAVLLGSLVMVNPPEGYQPQGWSPPSPEDNVSNGSVEFSSGNMLRTSQFYKLWAVFMVSALAGLMVIYCIRLFGVDALAHNNIADVGIIAGTAMAWYAIFNGAGRIAWGAISDKLGRKATIVLMTAMQGVVMLTMYHGFIYFGLTLGFIIASSLVGFNYGGIFALFPAITADYFGNKKVGTNYGWMFTAYGVAGIAGPLLAGFFKDAAGNSSDPGAWMTPFIIAGAACIAGAVLMMFTNPPSSNAIPDEQEIPEAIRKSEPQLV